MNSTLLTLFNARRATLISRLERAANLDETVSVLRSSLDEIQRTKINTLGAPQARRLSELLDVLRSAVELLATANQSRVWYAAPVVEDQSPQTRAPVNGKKWLIRHLTGFSSPMFRIGALKIRLLQGSICAGLLFFLFVWTRDTWTAWPAIALMLILVCLEILASIRSTGNANLGAMNSEAKVEIRPDVATLLDRLAEALDVIDRAIGGALEENKQPSSRAERSPIESVPELLSVIQDLIGEAMQGDASLTLKRSNELPTALTHFGITVQNYEAHGGESSEGHASHELFDCEPSLDAGVTAPVTLKPALVCNGKVLLRGRVVLPVGETNS